MNDSNTPIRLEHRAGGVAILTLSQGARKNLVNEGLATALSAHVAQLEARDDLRCVLLRAEGTMFSAGGDVRDMQANADDLPGHIDRLIRPVHQAVAAFYGLRVPVVCSLQGTAAGGGLSLALACDIVVAARSARLVFAYAQLGTTPDCGLTHALTERLGPVAALQLLLSRDSVTAAEGADLGLVQQVADDDAVQAQALALAERVAAMPPMASQGLKRLLVGDARQRLMDRLDAEHASFVRCAGSPDFRARVVGFGKSHG